MFGEEVLDESSTLFRPNTTSDLRTMCQSWVTQHVPQ